MHVRVHEPRHTRAAPHVRLVRLDEPAALRLRTQQLQPVRRLGAREVLARAGDEQRGELVARGERALVLGEVGEAHFGEAHRLLELRRQPPRDVVRRRVGVERALTWINTAPGLLCVLVVAIRPTRSGEN